MNDYMVVCNENCCFNVYKRKRFLFIPYWSFMCEAISIDSATHLVNNLRLINNEAK